MTVIVTYSVNREEHEQLYEGQALQLSHFTGFITSLEVLQACYYRLDDPKLVAYFTDTHLYIDLDVSPQEFMLIADLLPTQETV